MVDILLTRDGDIALTENGDISLTDSIRQAVSVRLKWIFKEWRLGPQYGLPWFEEIFVKNPNIPKIKSLIRSEIVQTEGVTNAVVDSVKYDPKTRSAHFVYTVYIGEDKYMEEVELNG